MEPKLNKDQNDSLKLILRCKTDFIVLIKKKIILFIFLTTSFKKNSISTSKKEFSLNFPKIYF